MNAPIFGVPGGDFLERLNTMTITRVITRRRFGYRRDIFHRGNVRCYLFAGDSSR